jgi:5-methylcytosine-specific restriction endonuclease McrA
MDKKQLDVDHIDGNPSNNKPENLQTLCKPCHIVKTRENREYKSR